MAMTTTADSFLHAITTATGVDRWAAMRIYADFCEERGEGERAKFWRWAARESVGPWSSESGKTWYWHRGGIDGRGHVSCELDPEVFHRLRKRPRRYGILMRTGYRSEVKAWLDLEQAMLAWQRELTRRLCEVHGYHEYCEHG